MFCNLILFSKNMCVKFIEERIPQAFEMSLKYKSGSTIYHNSAFIECIETLIFN
jgi:hypothetical protein